MDSTIPANSVPKVSVIIPARNEEANLERCLRSLVVQKGVAFEILVVNDASTDRTRALPRALPGFASVRSLASIRFLVDVHVLDAPQPLPEGWTGKANALVAGEAAARGEWLLFTDADTEHLEGSLAAAVAEAEQHRADLLSYSPEQLLTGVRQQLLMPLIFGELATQVQSSARQRSRVCRTPPPTANTCSSGRRFTARIGGFASVATELLEDVALARRYKQQGHTIRFRLGRGLVRTRMYNYWEELRLGWTKNLALALSQCPRTRPQTHEGVLLAPAFTLAANGIMDDVYVPDAGAGRATGSACLVGFLLGSSRLLNFAVFYARVARAHFPFGTDTAVHLRIAVFCRFSCASRLKLTRREL